MHLREENLFHAAIDEARHDLLAVDRQHAELLPNDFTVGISLQLALNFVPNLLLRIELRNFGAGVIVALDEDPVTGC